jgi:hypothetical protein
LETDDLDAECARISAADGPYERPLGRDATFVDPDGAIVLIRVTPEFGG